MFLHSNIKDYFFSEIRKVLDTLCLLPAVSPFLLADIVTDVLF